MKVTVRAAGDSNTVYGELELTARDLREISRNWWQPITVDGIDYKYSSYCFNRVADSKSLHGALYVSRIGSEGGGYA